jgi:hypothetical protein
MERIQALVSRLQEQVSQKAGHAQLMATAQQIVAELNQATGQAKSLGTSKIAVMMPATPHIIRVAEELNTVKEEPVQPITHKPKAKSQNQLDLYFDAMHEIPTLSQQASREVNQTVAQKESLNDKLKEEKTEVMHKLKDSPIRDLRKAIGINDRFVLINELFRGDEAMYERCIKTINSFNIYPEAEYWMNRELMVKLGWDENRESVKHFYQLVKRRFA